jgi:hypothetical protein
MKIIISFILTVLFLQNSFGQNDSIKKHKIDSLTKKLTNDSLRTFRFKKYRPFANIDNRNSFIRSQPVNFNGFQLGLIYKEYHTFGMGFYRMTEESKRPIKTRDNTRTINQTLTLNYSTFFYQYVLLDKRYFEIDLPFEIGIGKYHIILEDSITKHIYKNVTAPIIPFGAGVQFIIKPFKWIGVAVSGGYRYVAEKNVNANSNFNGFYYSYGVWLDIRQIYRDIKFYGVQKKKYRRDVRAILN